MLDKLFELDRHNEEPKPVEVDLRFRGDLRDERQNRSLAQALDNSSNYIFDMSDRWKDAFLESLHDPIYPAPEKVDLMQELQKVDLIQGIQSILLGSSQRWEE